MAKMIAALPSCKAAMRIAEIDRPVAGRGDAIIGVRGAGICGSDLLNYGANTTPETVPGGHEVAGDIVEMGDGVDPSRVG